MSNLQMLVFVAEWLWIAHKNRNWEYGFACFIKEVDQKERTCAFYPSNLSKVIKQQMEKPHFQKITLYFLATNQQFKLKFTNIVF